VDGFFTAAFLIRNLEETGVLSTGIFSINPVHIFRIKLGSE
jgi:hypothetical protein